MKKMMIGILGLALAFSCNSGSSNSESASEESGSKEIIQEDIDAEMAYEMINEGDVVLIDVRSVDEFAGGHIEGALNVDVNSSDFQERMSEFDMSKSYVVYCQSGRRSANSSQFMIELGFEKVYNVAGGINEWIGTNHEVITGI